jgi:hypothetical protein
MDPKDWYWNTYLWSEHWRDFRQRYYTHFGKVVCAVCSQDGKLHLHHNTYATLKR